jgi:hypothetical protein
VVNVSGDEAWLRVHAQVVLYTKVDSDWVPLTGVDLQDELDKYLYLAPKPSPTPEQGKPTPTPYADPNYGPYVTPIITVGPLPEIGNPLVYDPYYFGGDDSKVIEPGKNASQNARWDTVGEVVDAILSSANTNCFNWAYVPVAPGEGYYYYINAAENNAILDSTTQALTLDTTTSASERLARFSGENHASAPLFTYITTPDISNAVAYLFNENYRIVLQFEGQMVSAQGGGDDWESCFYMFGTGSPDDVLPTPPGTPY